MGAYGGLGDHIQVSVVSDSRLSGLEAKIWKLFLELLGRGHIGTLIISLKRQFLCGKNGTKYQFLYANHSRYMSYASDIFCSITLVTFPILRMSISFKVACIVVLTNLLKNACTLFGSIHFSKATFLVPRWWGLGKVQLLPGLLGISFNTNSLP